jgi:hypothetical protein
MAGEASPGGSSRSGGLAEPSKLIQPLAQSYDLQSIDARNIFEDECVLNWSRKLLRFRRSAVSSPRLFAGRCAMLARVARK